MKFQFENYYAKLLNQLSIDFNCTTTDLQTKGNTITISALNEGRRNYDIEKPFLKIATLGESTVIMADKCLHDFFKDFSENVQGHNVFKFENLLKIDEELKKYGYTLTNSHHMFLPCNNAQAEECCEIKWLYDNEILPFYGDNRFPNAIAYPVPCPVRPDKIAVVAVEGDKIMGMAGCSVDAPGWQQIGIDVLEEYRSRKIATYLVSLLKNKIIEMGDVPFYGVDVANIQSRNVALKSGFRPSWIEISSRKI